LAARCLVLFSPIPGLLLSNPIASAAFYGTVLRMKDAVKSHDSRSPVNTALKATESPSGARYAALAKGACVYVQKRVTAWTLVSANIHDIIFKGFCSVFMTCYVI